MIDDAEPLPDAAAELGDDDPEPAADDEPDSDEDVGAADEDDDDGDDAAGVDALLDGVPVDDEPQAVATRTHAATPAARPARRSARRPNRMVNIGRPPESKVRSTKDRVLKATWLTLMVNHLLPECQPLFPEHLRGFIGQ